MSEKPSQGPEVTGSEGSPLWIEETYRDGVAFRVQVDEVLFSGVSEFQKVEVVKTPGLGRMLLNDGLVMLSERDEFIYHEMIAHVPLFTHPAPERVLIIGGGDGGTAREVLRHPGVRTCRMVEIDEMVVQACREHIPLTAGELDNPRLTLTIDDGVRFMAETDETFDVIIIDSTDPIGPATPLFGEAFYRNVQRVLGENGVVVSQGESVFYEAETQKSLVGVLRACFDKVWMYNFSNMTYPGGLWSFTFASKGPDPLGDLDPARIQKAGLKLQYYDAAVHRAAFTLPVFLKQRLAGLLNEVD